MGYEEELVVRRSDVAGGFAGGGATGNVFQSERVGGEPWRDVYKRQVCMLLTRKILSINNVKDNIIIFAKKII